MEEQDNSKSRRKIDPRLKFGAEELLSEEYTTPKVHNNYKGNTIIFFPFALFTFYSML